MTARLSGYLACTVRRHICCFFKSPKTSQHIGCFANICDAALYILLLEGQKGVNIWGVVNIWDVNICDAGQYIFYNKRYAKIIFSRFNIEPSIQALQREPDTPFNKRWGKFVISGSTQTKITQTDRNGQSWLLGNFNELSLEESTSTFGQALAETFAAQIF